ncbi:hypothetical protein [uncultured Algimonas sp.]|uniref:hypothetical protein n=1 Tax=uncultured Algimonas sp. TaxID=1547920 RepID=UPI00262A409B|nr:hypothetical protein [uncultured Algimonas sp.]
MTALAACGAPPTETQNAPQATAECRIDADARIPWSDWRPEDDVSGTAIFDYSGCSKRLVFIAAEHENDPASDTFAAVRQMIAGDPDLVLIEGVPAQRGRNYQPVLDHAARVEATPGDNESMLAARLSDARGIPFVGAEPRDDAVLDYALENGVSEVELIGFYVLRQLPQMARSGEVDSVDGPDMAAAIEDLVPYFADETGLDREAVADIDTLPEFQEWYAGFNDRSFDEVLDMRDSVPSASLPDPARSNFISDIVADARDDFILARIEDALDAHDHVLIVYGGSHQTVQDPALQAAFGAPTRLR